MKRDDLLLWLLGGAIVAWIVYNRQSVTGTLETAGETAQAAFMGWQNVNQGPVWVPVINQTEDALGLPANLLARQAYQESHYRQEIIDGSLASPTNALGILQLEPQYFSSVRVPTPFTTVDTQNQITEAGNYLASLYHQFGDWGAALAAYDDGPENVKKFLAGTRPLPLETRNYVTEILTDVPLPTSLTI